MKKAWRHTWFYWHCWSHRHAYENGCFSVLLEHGTAAMTSHDRWCTGLHFKNWRLQAETQTLLLGCLKRAMLAWCIWPASCWDEEDLEGLKKARVWKELSTCNDCNGIAGYIWQCLWLFFLGGIPLFFLVLVQWRLRGLFEGYWVGNACHGKMWCWCLWRCSYGSVFPLGLCFFTAALPPFFCL